MQLHGIEPALKSKRSAHLPRDFLEKGFNTITDEDLDEPQEDSLPVEKAQLKVALRPFTTAPNNTSCRVKAPTQQVKREPTAGTRASTRKAPASTTAPVEKAQLKVALRPFTTAPHNTSAV